MLGFLRRLFGRGGPADPFASLSDEQLRRLRLVVGLGNPGPRYAQTRHNVGFQVADLLGQRLGVQWLDDRERTGSLVALASDADPPLGLAKPQTYMNRSGEAVARLCERLGLEPDRLLVVYDDMDLPFGSLRLRARGGAGTHNGMRSLLAALESEAFPRLRIGISQAHGQVARDYVLGEFSAQERERLEPLLERAADAVLEWARAGSAAAMNRFNNR